MIVLSSSYAETGKFADQENLRGIFHINNRDAIRGLNPGVVHILPSYYDRRDFHSVNAELERMKRNGAALEVIEWERYPGGVFARADGAGVPEDAYDVDPPVNPQKSEPAISPPFIDEQPWPASNEAVIEDVQASQLAALSAAPAADDDFFAMLDSAGES